MAYATVNSCTLVGITALPVVVEIHITGGLPGMSIVGLPQSAVRESKDRVKAAIQHANFHFPQSKVVVNLAPADLPKRGGRFDLPIALGILIASDQIPAEAVKNLVVIGELGLTGKLRAVSGVLPTAQSLSNSERALLLPLINGREATRCVRTHVIGVSTLIETCLALSGDGVLPRLDASMFEGVAEGKPPGVLFPSANRQVAQSTQRLGRLPDMVDVLGQAAARRALEIAAAGRHNLLMVGPPGTGKSMLACRLPGIQPAMSEQEAMETASVASISYTGFDESRWGIRPFRTPHHTASGVALVGGGGSQPMPGEISLAHNGVLFLDELSEFPRSVLDVLREPMETGKITVSRAARQAEFPARFQLVAAMNPCPCGYDGDHSASTRCRCTADAISRYQSRLSGPFLDRIDLWVTVERPTIAERNKANDQESTEIIQRRVLAAYQRQLERQQSVNADLDPRQMSHVLGLDAAAQELVEAATERFELSLRAMHRLLRVARTIADLDEAEVVDTGHLAEALSLRAGQQSSLARSL
ncbi:MAG: YifB family Mg chelatase-like AAA ATPase [Granulosicoccus sp.]